MCNRYESSPPSRSLKDPSMGIKGLPPIGIKLRAMPLPNGVQGVRTAGVWRDWDQILLFFFLAAAGGKKEEGKFQGGTP